MGFLFINQVLAVSTEQLPDNIDQGTETTEQSLDPIITANDSVPINKKVLFSALDSTLLAHLNVQPIFKWDFGDQSPVQFGDELLHEFSASGKYEVMLTIIQGNVEAQISKEVFVYEKSAILITDKLDQLNAISDQAIANGLFLKVIPVSKADTEFLSEDQLVNQLTTEIDSLKKSNIFIFYTSSSIGIKAFARYWSNLSEDAKFDLQSKLLISVTDMQMTLTSKLIQQSFEVIRPNFILLTRKEALNPIFDSKDLNIITSTLENRGIEYKIINENSRPSNFLFLSRIVNYFVLNGVPASSIYLILAFPFIAFIIAFFRQIVGVAAFGVYAPAITALAFITLGVSFGLIIFFVVIAVSYIIRRIFSKVEILYIPRVSLLLSLISLSFLVISWFAIYLGSKVSLALAIFPMLVMSTISEKFISAQSEQGLKGALFGALQTVLMATISYFVVVWQPMVDLINGFPEVVILPLIGEIIVGRFTGLRLAEYFRFRSLLMDSSEEEE